MVEARANVFTGATLMVFGIVYFGLGLAFTILRCYGWQIGFQLWGACVFIVTAIFGMLANDKKKRDLVHGYTIFCSCSIVAAIIMIVGCAIAIANEYFGGYCRWFDWFMIEGCHSPVARMVIDICLLSFAGVGFFVAIGCTYVAGKVSAEAEAERSSRQKVYRH